MANLSHLIPCQGEGRRFESGLPLDSSSKSHLILDQNKPPRIPLGGSKSSLLPPLPTGDGRAALRRHRRNRSQSLPCVAVFFL